MARAMFLVGLLLLLSTPSSIAIFKEAGSGCDDTDDRTKCCPLDDFPVHFSSDFDDWRSCIRVLASPHGVLP